MVNRPSSSSAAAIHRPGIVLVDDHALFRTGLRALIQHGGMWKVVGEAKDEREMMAVLSATKADLVLMDMHLPSVGGVELTRRVLASFPGTKIVALSSDSSPTLVHSAIMAGVAGYVLKEDAMDELERAISSVLAGRTYFCAQVSGTVMDNLRQIAVTPAKPKHNLTERELEVVRMIAEGNRNKEIADALGVTVKSAETYRARVMKKLNLDSTASVTRFAVREGLIDP